MTEWYKFLLFPMDENHKEEDARTLPVEVYQEIVKRWARVISPHVYGAEIKFDVRDAEAAEIFRFLRAYSREPWIKAYPHAPYRGPRFYEVEGERQFSAEEIEGAEYLLSFADKQIGWGTRVEGTNQLQLEASRIKRQPIGRNIQSLCTICSDEIKEDMEKQNLVGLDFRPVFVQTRKPDPPKYWQWWSRITMPPLLNHLVQEDGKEVDENNPYASCRFDDIFWPYLLRFPREHVLKLKPYDVALTRERIGPGFHEELGYEPFALRDPWLIVSQKFRKWALSRRLKIEWIPIALE